jgi:hypothetical protein
MLQTPNAAMSARKSPIRLRACRRLARSILNVLQDIGRDQGIIRRKSGGHIFVLFGLDWQGHQQPPRTVE